MGYGRRAVSASEKDKLEVGLEAFIAHLADRIAQGCDLGVVGAGIAVIKYQHIHARLGEHGNVAAQHPRIARVVIPEFRLGPVKHSVIGNLIEDGIISPRIRWICVRVAP